MADIREQLDEVIELTLDNLLVLSPEDEGYKEATERIDKLYKLRIDEKRADSEIACNNDNQKSGAKDRIVRYVLDGVGIVLPIFVSWIWMGRGLRFEQTGSFTSRTGQWLKGFSRFGK